MSAGIPQGLASATYLHLTTTGRVSGKPRTVELWFVAHNGKIYMVTESPQRANWVRNLRNSPRVQIRIQDAAWNGTARVLAPEEQPLWDTVCRLACQKYNEPEPWGTPVEITLESTAGGA